MANTPLIGSVGTSTTPATQTSSKSVTNGDKDLFLKLLVAQLKYQDPSNPTDPQQFMAQTAQFTMVEKLDALADAQAKIASASELQSATSLVGRTISYLGGDEAKTEITGKVTGVTMSNGTATLTVDGKKVELSQLVSVQETPAATA